jgi:GDPmannose 4,6-dehydratase
MSKKKALIIGVLGQDGYYLSKFLISKGYEIHGIARSIPSFSTNDFYSVINIHFCDIVDKVKLRKIILEVKPDEIYHLAAYHFSAHTEANKENNFQTFLDVNVNSLYEILETLKMKLANSRLFYASSSHIFGSPAFSPQTELTNYTPNSLYGISKVTSGNLCNFYREYHNIYASVGILYNHESVLRTTNFLSSLIANVAAKAYLGFDDKLYLTDLNAIVDWGAAEDYVEAMWSTLQIDKSDTYIISSGVGRSVNDFAEVAFSHIGKSAIDYVFQKDVEIYNLKSHQLIGDPTKIKLKCNWSPKTSFQSLVTNLVDKQISKLSSKL